MTTTDLLDTAGGGEVGTQVITYGDLPGPMCGPVRTTEVGLLSRMWHAERLGHPSDRGSVPSTIHILVHLLRHLLHMAKVCCGDSYSAEGGEGQGEATNKHYTHYTQMPKIRMTEDQHNLLHHDDNVVNLNGLQSAVVTGK